MQLETLDLSYNTALYGSLPSSWNSALTGLRYLDLSHTALDGTVPASWSGFTRLRCLDLSHSSLCGDLPPDLPCFDMGTRFNAADSNWQWRECDGDALLGSDGAPSCTVRSSTCSAHVTAGPALDASALLELKAAVGNPTELSSWGDA
ncbi:Phytosulfokine receptor 1, partial [Tetrabaena socialis]